MILKIKISAFFVLALLFGILISGCQNPMMSEEPGSLLAKGVKATLNFALPTEGIYVGESKSVDLVAGRDLLIVGTVTTTRFADYLTVTYTTYSGWYITETHLQVAFDVTEGDFPDAFHLNKAYAPKIGNFDFNAVHESEIEFSMNIPVPENAGYVQIAAHGVVYALLSPSLFAFEEYLDSLNPVTANFFGSGIDGSKWSVELTFPDTSTELFPAWCIDPAGWVYPSNTYAMELISSYTAEADLLWMSELPFDLNYGNLGALNFLLNNLSEWPAAGTEAIQAAVHIIIAGWTNEPDYVGGTNLAFIALVDEMVSMSLANNDFTPGVGDETVVLLKPLYIDLLAQEPLQILIILLPMPGVPEEETAWARGAEFALDTSDWSMYFGFNLPE